jgi:calcineurin-like phosphoesterase family protein
MIYFAADTHFGHAAILKHCPSRPWATVEEMDQALIDNINAVVGARDTLYHLGDFAWRDVVRYRERINCRNIHLILGNHDFRITMANHNRAFQSVQMQMMLRHNRTKWLLNHLSFDGWYPGMHHLYGHHHSRKPGRWQNYHDEFHFSADAGVDAWGYKPVEIEELICYGNTLQAKVTGAGESKSGQCCTWDVGSDTPRSPCYACPLAGQ